MGVAGVPTDSVEAFLWRTLRRPSTGSRVDRSSSCKKVRAIVVGTGKVVLRFGGKCVQQKGEGKEKGKWRSIVSFWWKMYLKG